VDAVVASPTATVVDDKVVDLRVVALLVAVANERIQMRASGAGGRDGDVAAATAAALQRLLIIKESQE